jgi:anti-sigma B factor antagonist
VAVNGQGFAGAGRGQTARARRIWLGSARALKAGRTAVIEEHPVELSLNHRREGDRTVLEVAGEVDVYTAPKLREKLVELVGEGQYRIVVDMTKVEFLDSTGLGVLVGGLKRVRSHDGSLALVCNQERILKIFRITGLTKVFPMYESLDEALQD